MPESSPHRKPPYLKNNSVVTATEELSHSEASSTIPELEIPAYRIEPAWIDTAGRTRTWALKDPHGTQMAEITTKRAAQKLAQLLNRVMDDKRGPTR